MSACLGVVSVALLYGNYFAATGAASPSCGETLGKVAVVLGLGCFSEDLEQALFQLYVQGSKPLLQNTPGCSLFLPLCASF